jgi:anti-sigma-K factor RskA
LKFTLPVPVDPEPAPPPPSWPAPLPPAAPVAQAAAAPPDWPPEPAAAVPRVSLLDRLIVWRIAAGVLLLATTGLGVALLRSGPPPLAVAAIGVANAPAPLFLAEADAGGSLRLTPLAVIAVPNGRDLQLWMQPPGGKEPVSLGLLSASGSTVSLGGPPVEGTRLLISLEPRGGAMSGHITGQVLYGGTLANR